MSPQPRIEVKAGPSLSSLTTVDVNSATPHGIKTADFEGAVSVRMVDYLGPPGHDGTRTPPTEMRDGSTWSIAMQGRWKDEVNADEVMWGNYWEKPIRDFLPYGTAAALKFVHLVDPALSADVYADQPWALSPLIATMNYVQVKELEAAAKLPTFSPDKIEDDVTPLFKDATPEIKATKGDKLKRKAYLNDAHKRKEVTIPPNAVVEADFCNGYIDFNTLSLKLPIGLSFALEKYWDGQPVAFVCRNRSGSKEYFFVTFQIVREGESKPVETQQPEEENQDNLGVD